MKTIIALLIVLISAGCAQGGGSSPAPQPTTTTTPQIACSDFAGTYDNEFYFGETLDIDINCNFTDSICGYDASFTLPDENADSIVSVRNTDGTPGCMSSTDHQCVVAFNGDDLIVTCDDAAHVFSFDKR
jgi:hypothetical protein